MHAPGLALIEISRGPPPKATAPSWGHVIFDSLFSMGPQIHDARARREVQNTSKTSCKDIFADLAVAGLHEEIEHYCDLGTRVVNQARRRILDKEQLVNAEKIYSIFEPHTDLIKRGKVRTPLEFGHKIFLAESANGLITQYQVLRGNPADEQHVGQSLGRHKKAFGRAPELYSADRGFFSERNLTQCRTSGVAAVCIPQC